MKIAILSRWTNAIQIEVEIDDKFSIEPRSTQLGEAVRVALRSGSDLRGSDLRGSNLRGSNLRGSNLRGSDLSGSNLRGSNLSGSDLSGSDLSDSDLSGSDLRGSDLSGSNLSGSDLRGSNLSGSDLRGSNLRGSNLRGSNLRGSNLRGILSLVKVPSLHRKVLAAIDAGGELEMGSWHTCETTHCRAGWAIHLAGPAGAMLEATWGAPVAGALIHLASCPEIEKVPDFYASNEDALADIRREAEKEPELAEVVQ